MGYFESIEKYDDLDNGPLASALGFNDLRSGLVGTASGAVLEVGGGTGINLPFYDYDNIKELVILDLSSKMLDQARSKVQKVCAGQVRQKISFVSGNVERLPFPDKTFDTVLDTFSLCVFSDPDKAIAEMKRVLKDDGRMLLLEHTRSSVPLLGAYQDITSQTVSQMGKNCVWNQDVAKILSSKGFTGLQDGQGQHLLGLVSSFQVTKTVGSTQR